jgi:hypothetical protein
VADLCRLWVNRRRSTAYATRGFCRLGGRRTELQRVSRHRRWLRGPADRFLHCAERRRQHDGHGSVPEMGSRQQLPADRPHRIKSRRSRLARGFRLECGTFNRRTDTRFGNDREPVRIDALRRNRRRAGARLHFRDAFDGRLQLRGRVFGISDTTSCALEDGLAVGPQDIVAAESSRCEETNPGGGTATTAFLFTLSVTNVNGSPLGRFLGWKVHLRRAIDILSAMHLSQVARSRGAGLYARPELPAFAARVAADAEYFLLSTPGWRSVCRRLSG